MDRNLGARDTKRAVDYKGVLCYQWGRKDPIAGDTTGNFEFVYKGRSSSSHTVVTSRNDLGVPISSSVLNPMTVFTSSTNWSSDVSSVSYIWLDYETDVSTQEKSIFDPSPLGWKVAPYGTFETFSIETMSDWDYNEDSIGFCYPRDSQSGLSAYFPSNGFLHPTTAEVYVQSAWIVISQATPSSITTSYSLSMRPIPSVNGSNMGYRADSYNTRCVQHYE